MVTHSTAVRLRSLRSPSPKGEAFFACCKPFPRSRAARALRVRLRANTTTRCPRSAQDDTKGLSQGDPERLLKVKKQESARVRADSCLLFYQVIMQNASGCFIFFSKSRKVFGRRSGSPRFRRGRKWREFVREPYRCSSEIPALGRLSAR